MVGWHHQLNGHEFEQALGVGEGQGSLACCSPCGCEELDRTERLKNNNKVHQRMLSKKKKKERKGNIQNGRKSSQTIFLIRNSHTEYAKNFYNSTTKTQTTQLKMGEGLE